MIEMQRLLICSLLCCGLLYCRATARANDEAEVPWDYSPYRVLVWVSSDDPSVNADDVAAPLRAYLDRDFAAVWRTDIAKTPTPIASIAARNFGRLDYDVITAWTMT